MALEKDTCISNFKKVLHILVSNEKVKEQECDILVQQYSFFLDEIPKFGLERFKKFDKANSSVDELFYECMSQDPCKYKGVLEVFKLLLTLSHGQAAVERGFSVNKEVEVENMKHETVVAQRLICDYVRSVGGIQNVDINKQLLTSVKGARQKYEVYLEKDRHQAKTAAELGKRKHIIEKELQQKKTKLEQDICV